MGHPRLFRGRRKTLRWEGRDTLHPLRKGPMPMAFVRCYLDGSEDTEGHVFGVGGFVGYAEQWDTLQSAWLEALPVGVDYFHTTDCFSGNRQFQGIDIPQRVSLLNTLTDFVANGKLQLICHGIDVPLYHQFASQKKKLDPFGQNKYGTCFGRAIGLACECMGPKNTEAESGCAFFIERDEFEATAKREFMMLRARPEIWYRDRIGTESYGDKKGKNAIPLLQVADLGAFLGLKYIAKCRPGKIDWRPYYHRLRDAGCVYKCSKDKRGEIKAMAKKLKELKHGDRYRLPG